MTDMRTPEAHDAPTDDSASPDPMAQLNDILMEQALTLDAMFVELVQKAADNLNAWPTTAERFARLALRAQSNCRASLDTMARADRAARRGREGEAA